MVSRFNKTIFSILPDLKKIDSKEIETGDLYIQKKMTVKVPLLYMHSGMYVREDNNSITGIDCAGVGCRIVPNKTLKANIEYFVVRLPSSIPNREAIIDTSVSMAKYIIKNNIVSYIEMSRLKVWQFVRIISGRCIGRVGWDELFKYIERYITHYVKNTKLSKESYATFCSRFVLIIYQLSAIYVWVEKERLPLFEVKKLMETYFPFSPKYCRPWHILMLARANPSWEVYAVRQEEREE